MKSDLPHNCPTPPWDLPGETDRFWRAGAEVDVLQAATPADPEPALRRLGPPPFPKSKFPFLGFLATVYDHVATHAVRRTHRGVGP